MEEKKTRLVRFFLILFAPKSKSNEFYFTIENIPIGWIIIGLCIIVNMLLKLFNLS